MGDFATDLQMQQAVQGSRVAPQFGQKMSAEKAHQTAEDFEAFFLSQMLQPMFSGIEAEEPFGGGASEEVWRSMLVDEYGKSLARSGGIGIADQVMREILRAQEVQ